MPKLFSLNNDWRATTTLARACVLGAAITLTGTFGLRAADDAAAQKLLAESRSKEMHAQQLRAAAATTLQRAADDEMEAGAEEREARILTARALALLGADANKQRAFRLRQEWRKLTLEANNMFIAGRNSEQRAAQEAHNAEELKKAAAQLKDQPTIAAALENEAKEQSTKAQTDTQTAGQEKFGAQSLEDRAKAALTEAEKLDPETLRQVAPASPRPPVAAPRPIK